MTDKLARHIQILRCREAILEESRYDKTELNARMTAVQIRIEQADKIREELNGPLKAETYTDFERYSGRL